MSKKVHTSEEGEVYITLKAANGKNETLDPFVVSKTTKDAINGGEVKEAKTLKNGEYLLHVTEKQAKRLTRIKKLKDGTKVKYELHPTMNRTKSTISHPSIVDISDEKLKQELEPQGVTDVKSIGDSKRLKVVTTAGTKAPQALYIGLLRVKTMKYYPMVITCNKCCQVGHSAEECQQTKRCRNCSGKHTAECKNPPYCGNCGGDHPPHSKECTLLMQEKAIIKLQVNERLKPHKARKVYRKRYDKYIPLPGETKTNGFFDLEEEDPLEVIEAEEMGTEETVDDPPEKIQQGGTPSPKTAKKKKSAGTRKEDSETGDKAKDIVEGTPQVQSTPKMAKRKKQPQARKSKTKSFTEDESDSAINEEIKRLNASLKDIYDLTL